MRRHHILASLIFGLAALGASSAMAQLPFSDVPVSRPTVSPYLSLLDNNNNANGGFNSTYFTQVRPRIEARNQLYQQQSQINNLQRQISTARSTAPAQTMGIRSTGHSAGFMNMSHYYPQRR